MSRIRILPEVLSNKIAAGEVVERPASVVKELIENAVDAESTKVVLEIKKGGRALIRASDNGVGMDYDDAVMCTERHATSKIYDEKGLFSIATLGFRGEALPSIASVSDMEIITRIDSADAGTRIMVQGGKTGSVSEVGAPRGTMVSVNRLFFNTPARRKHLKTDKTEMGHISDTVSRMAIAWPDIHFKFLHNGRTLANWSSTPDRLHRIADVLKDESLEGHLHEVDYKDGNIRVHGFVASSSVTRATSRGLYTYVNGRFVRDKLLDHGVVEGYSGRLMKGRFPLVALFVTLPFDQVDVNVHPSKDLVRFLDPRQVYDAVAGAVKRTLETSGRLGWGQAGAPRPRVGQSPTPYTTFPAHGKVGESAPRPLSRPYSPPVEATAPLWPIRPFSSLRVIGQLHSTYVMCESEDGMVLIDQHAAHERVVFESLKAAYGQSDIATQGLLIPERLELSYREASILDALLKGLSEIGLEIEPFGGRTYLVKSVPDMLAGKPVKPLVMEIIEKMAEVGLASGLHHAVDECLTVMACHGAIRAKERLSDEEMKTLLKQLDNLKNASHCPHGRPIIVHRSLYQIEKDFKRVV
jgi:DNA mismatch repair protein MutL